MVALHRSFSTAGLILTALFRGSPTAGLTPGDTVPGIPPTSLIPTAPSRSFYSPALPRQSCPGGLIQEGMPGPISLFLSPFRPDMVILPALGGFFFLFSVRYFSTFFISTVEK